MPAPSGDFALPLLRLPDLDDSVLGAGHRALDEEQALLRVDGVDRQAELRHADATHATRHLRALEDARRRDQSAGVLFANEHFLKEQAVVELHKFFTPNERPDPTRLANFCKSYFGSMPPNMKEVVFQGALDPHTPIAQGWLRASHRKLDAEKSSPWRPYHTHDEIEPLTPGEVYPLDIEIWPTSIVVPADYRIGLTVRGRDYVYPGGSGGRLSNMKNEFTGVGPFLHDDPRDRPVAVYGGTTTIHLGGGRESFVLLPVIPAR